MRGLRPLDDDDEDEDEAAPLTREAFSCSFAAMPTYIYETIPASASERPERFEIKQSMKDEPLTRHPESGLPVRRVISGGYGFSVGGAAAPSSGHSCGGPSCGCHN